MNVMTRIVHDREFRKSDAGRAQDSLDRLARGLGWFSIVLGASQVLGAERYTRFLGVEGHEGFVRVCGLREIGHGVASLSSWQTAGLWSRVGGDGLDIGVLASAMRKNSKRGNVAIALAAAIGIAALDVKAARELTARAS